MNAASATFRSIALRVGAESSAFTTWWLRELHEAWISLAEWLNPKRAQRFMVELGTRAGTIYKVGASDPGREFAFGPQDHLPPLGELWPIGTRPRARVSVFLPESAVLRCHLQLPPMPRASVAGAVDLLLERELPLARDQLCIAWAVTDVRTDSSRLVTVVIARRTDIKRLQEDVAAWGWMLTAIGLKGADGRLKFNLLPSAANRFSLSFQRCDHILAWSALALCLIYILSVGGRLWYERTTLAEPLADARAQAALIAEKRTALQKHSEPLLVLNDLMRSTAVHEVLLAISTAVPQDSWIYQADIRAPLVGDAVIKLSGYTPTATTLVELLERSEQLSQVQLVQATSGGIGSGVDRVEVTATMERKLR